jgi:hypothetical protein
MNATCNKHGRNEKYIQNVSLIPEGKSNLRDLILDRRIILKWTLKE